MAIVNKEALQIGVTFTRCIECERVEVVRCKDCKYYEIHKPTITLNCEREGKLIPMMPNDYCSYGERKEQK